MRLSKTEELLIKKGYWYWTIGDESNPPTIKGTPKWIDMINDIITNDPSNLISEEIIIDKINDDINK